MKLISLLPKFNKLFLLPAIAGILLAFTLPPFNISFFLWIAFIPLFFFIDNYGLNLKQIFGGGLLFGSIYAIKAVYPLLSLNAWWWVDVKSIIYENRIIFLFWVLFLIIIYNSLLFGLFSLIYKKLRKHNLLDALTFPTLWAGMEYFRAKTLLDFSWGHLGYALHDNTYILQIAKIFKLYGLSFFIILVNILVYLVMREINFKNPVFAGRKAELSKLDILKKLSLFIFKNRFFCLLIFIILPVNLYGFYAVKAGEAKLSGREKLSVAIIQPGMETEKITLDFYFKNLRETINSSLTAKPDLLILPENSFPFLILNQDNGLMPLNYKNDKKIKKSYDSLINISKNNPKTSIIIGLHTAKGFQTTYNSLIVLERGQITGLYSKRKLLPFSESPDKLFFTTSIEPLGKGGQKQTVKIKGLPVTALLCSEIMFPGLSVNKNTRFIINIGNDSVFSSETVAEQNHIMAQIRAVENNKYVIRGMKTGISSIINPFGETLIKSDYGKKINLINTQIKK